MLDGVKSTGKLVKPVIGQFGRMYTHVHVYAGHVEGEVRWLLFENVSVELGLLEEPLYRVEERPLEVVMAGQLHCVAGPHHRRHVDCQILQARRTCEKTLSLIL